MAKLEGFQSLPDEAGVVEGIDEARVKIRAFLKALSESIEVEGNLTIGIFSAGSPGAGEDPIGEVEFDLTEPLEKTVQTILEGAARDAEGYVTGKAKFTLRVEGYGGRCTFTLKVTPPEGEDEDDINEMPNRKGLITQQMRHNEKLVRVNVTYSDKMYNMMMRLLHEKDDRIRQLEKTYMDAVKKTEELIDGRFVRDMEVRKIENQERRSDQVAQLLMQGLPALANKFLGGGAKLVNEPRTPTENMLEGFLMSFDRNQLMKIAQSGLLSEIQLAGFMQIISTVQERHMAEEEKRVADRAAQNGATQSTQTPSAPSAS